MSARILTVTPDEYHADPCEQPSLSSSIARTMVSRSPAHAYVEHPRFGNKPNESTAATTDGDIIHKLLLTKGRDIDVLHGFDNYRTKAAQEQRDEAITAGRIPVLEHKYEALEIAAKRLRENLRAFDIVLDGDSEVAIEFTEAGHQGDVLCRCMVDHIKFDRGIVYDVKKIRSADAHTRMRHAYEYGYDIATAAYTAGVTQLEPSLTGRLDFVFLFVEIDPPYAVVPARPSGALRDMGESRWQRAVASWEQCLATGYWPSYTEHITELDAPGWALSKEEAASET